MNRREFLINLPGLPAALSSAGTARHARARREFTIFLAD